jgi:molybdate transport system substrate-binding protein
MYLLRFLLSIGVAFSLFAASDTWAQTRADVTVYAAASLKESLDALARQFEKQQALSVRVSYGATSALARQIEKGAPADVFIAADLEWMDYLARRQLLRVATRGNLLSNRLVLIAPADSKVALTIAPKFPLAEALGANRLALADPASVPAGKYARAALEALGVWPAVSSRIAPGENVRAAMALVARGEAPLGIVYRTDVLAESRVRVIGEFPASLHSPIVYPAAVLAESRSPSAQVLLQFLRSAEARSVWRKYGFVVEAAGR